MEYLVGILEQLTGDTAAFRVVFTLTIALAIFVFALAILYILFTFSSPLRRRLQVATGVQSSSGTLANKMNSAVEPLSQYVLPKKDWERNKISERLVHAGFRTSNALTTFYMIKSILVIVLPGIVVLGAPLFHKPRRTR